MGNVGFGFYTNPDTTQSVLNYWLGAKDSSDPLYCGQATIKVGGTKQLAKLQGGLKSRGSDFSDFLDGWKSKIIGQNGALEDIAPYIRIWQAGLAPEKRPAGVFLMLGPTGVGKSRAVEALAEVLHDSGKNVLRIDCGEYAMDHEVAKLIGAPPGYIGHRETTPIINQARVNSMKSEKCGLSLVLFDEIEKASPAFHRLLLGVLEYGTMKSGDNLTTNFETSLIFMTSNLGQRQIGEVFGWAAAGGSGGPTMTVASRQRENKAVLKKFSLEFVNRLDVITHFNRLGDVEIRAILELELAKLQGLIYDRLGVGGFVLSLTSPAREFLIARGTSPEWGARELRRTIHKQLTTPLAAWLVGRERAIHIEEEVEVRTNENGTQLVVVPDRTAIGLKRAV